MFSKWPVFAFAAALTGVTGGSLTYISHERAKEQQITAQNQSLSSSLAAMQNQVAALNQKVSELSQPKPAAEPAPVPPVPAPRKVTRPVRRVAKAPAAPREDPRIAQMQAQLADQQQQLAGTRDDLDKTKDELNGRLDSTRDELSTSIAKNHDEVVELEKRGERTYYEFQLDKSKQFRRIGPLQLSLRKADTKHKDFNVEMLVDDNQLQKKNVNLYEPVWIDMNGERLELVVNQINKDHIQGYVDEPKYKQNEVRAANSNPAPQP